MPNNAPFVPARRDPDRAHPVPTDWRPTLLEVVRGIAEADFTLSRGIAGVAPVDEDTAKRIRANLTEYGATLVELPSTSWDTSVTQWEGNAWKVLVDLWTQEEGSSDLVLEGTMRESESGRTFSVHLVYVP